jgi:hypothetical protein
MTYIQNVKTRTRITIGTSDPRVPHPARLDRWIGR